MNKLEAYLSAKKNHYSHVPDSDWVTKANHFLDTARAIFEDTDTAHRVFVYTNLFNQLDGEDKAMLAGMYSDIIKTMIQDGTLAKLPTKPLSMAVSAYAINVDTMIKGGGMFTSRGDRSQNRADQATREAICFKMVVKPEIVDKINPAARILLLASVKQSELYKKGEKDFQLLANHHRPVYDRIEAAYDNIRVDYSIDKGEWDSLPWPKIAGGFGICAQYDRVDELYFLVRDDNQRYSDDERRATADILIEVKELWEHLDGRCSDARFNIAMKYPHIALKLIEQPDLQQGVFAKTERTMENIAKHHGGDVYIAYLEHENQQLKSQLKTLKAENENVPTFEHGKVFKELARDASQRVESTLTDDLIAK